MIAAQPLDMDQLLKATMARPPERPGQPRGVSDGRLQVLSDLEPATDTEAGAVPPPQLGLTGQDLDRIEDLAQAWRDAKAVAVKAEQAVTSASRSAARLPGLQRDAGEHAARAFSMNGKGRSYATSAVEAIDASKLAQSSLPMLERERDVANDRASQARGALHRECTTALRAALRRSIAHYNASSLEMTRALAAVDAVVGALPATISESMVPALNLMKHHLMVPALGSEFGVPADRGAASDKFVPSVLSGGHSRLHAHTRAARGHLDLALREALGPSIDPGVLLR